MAISSVTDLGVTTVLSYTVALALIVACSSLITFLLYVEKQKWRLKHIPGPKRSSIIWGNLKEMRKVTETGKTLVDVIIPWQKEFGPVFKYSIYHRFPVIGHDPDVVKEILNKSVHPKSDIPYDTMGTVFGNRLMGTGLVTEKNHAKWKAHRAMLNPSFHRKYLMDLVETFNESSDRLVEHLMKKANGIQEVAMYDAFNNITLDIIAKVAFGLELNVIEDPESPFPKAVLTTLNAIIQNIRKPLRRYGFTSADRQYMREVKEACTLLRRVGRDCIENRIAARSRGEEVHRDMLTNILDLSQNLTSDHDFGMEEMIDEFVTFFIAGQETTSNLLSFTLELLGKHPDALKKVQDELEEKVGSKPNISYQDIFNLDYMMLVFKEALRMYAPAPFIARVAGHDIVASNGLVIPEGTRVNLSPYAMGRMPEYFPDPDVFRPERFKAENTSPNQTYAYFPFAMGPRSCIGQQFALIEARIIMAKLLRIFKFDLVPGQSWNVSYAITIRPVDRCKNYVSIRE